MRDCTFTVERGKITCLAGPNGAGKTTIFNVITGFLKPDAGSVSFLGRSLAGMKPRDIVAAGIARTFQNLRLFVDLTALDNVAVALPDQMGEAPIAAIFRPFRVAHAQTARRAEAMRILAFLGHNGAGKTTTSRAAMGLLRRHEGEIAFDGQSIARLTVAERGGLGLRMLPEGRGIFPDLSVAENIDVVAARNVGPGALFDIAATYTLFPVLDERRATRAGSMSGGQQQMLALSLAILGSRGVCCWMNPRSVWRPIWWSGCSRRCAKSANRMR